MTSKRVGTVLASLAALVCLGNLAAEPIRALRDPLNTDFVVSFRVAALMLHQGDTQVYCISCLQSSIYQLYGMHPIGTQIFAYPPLVALALVPISVLGVTAGLGAFLFLSLLALALTAKWLASLANYDQKFTVLILGLASLPAAVNFAWGQIDPLILLAFVGGLVVAKNERWWLAGCCFGLAIAKPQVIWLIPFALIGLRQWKAMAAMAMVGLAWVATSIWIVGTSGIHQLLSDALPVDSGQVARSVGLPGLTFLVTGSKSVSVALGLIAGLIIGVALVLLGPRFLRQPLDFLAFAVAAGVATAPHSLPYTLICVAPLFILWGQRNLNLVIWSAIGLNVAYLIDLQQPGQVGYAEAVWILGTLGVFLWSVARPRPAIAAQPPSIQS